MKAVKEILELQEELRDMRLELSAQEVLIRSILNIIDEAYSSNVRESIFNTIDSCTLTSLSESIDDEGKSRIVELDRKIKRYLTA